MRTIRASEIGSYLFCQRAWWYLKSGLPSENLPEMAAGSEVHKLHGRHVLGTSCLQTLGYLLLLLSLVALVAFLTSILI
jgi:CRISPR/Cas system-associated exonuclease Cas4 (RecB family)